MSDHIPYTLVVGVAKSAMYVVDVGSVECRVIIPERLTVDVIKSVSVRSNEYCATALLALYGAVVLDKM